MNASSPTVLDPQWVRSRTGHFHRFARLDPEEEGLVGVSGVYVIWHGGVRPGWVYTGKSSDLAATFHELGENDEIMDFDARGGLIVSWALIRDKFQDGVLLYLNETLKPEVKNPTPPNKKATPIPVYAPGYAAAEK